MTVLDDVNLDVEPGEFVTLLGPSGSGKTTLLMGIAGFVDVNGGSIYFDGQDVTHSPPEKRNIGMVFQSYALFPHMTIAENVAFPLNVRNVAKAQRDLRVKEALDRVQLGKMADRNPAQLSGGQRQRVALARALVFEPSLLLMDEPLSALDKSLREEMQFEIRAIQQRLGITTISVTHDQREALTMADRVAVMRQGRIEQYGTAEEVFERPINSFVASFIGDATLFAVERRDGFGWIGNQLLCEERLLPPAEKVHLVIRADDAALCPEKPSDCVALKGTIMSSAYQGSERLFSVALDDTRNTVVRQKVKASHGFTPGADTWLSIDRDRLIIVPEA
ncbi:ABC transporter ATP-binding protein [Sinorhizobium meliloti]|uniref:ABC transporter ATP-binding protein n=1 Tax=Rhizobium meliloti TaxID=382 RepID=UPI003D6606C5